MSTQPGYFKILEFHISAVRFFLSPKMCEQFFPHITKQWFFAQSADLPSYTWVAAELPADTILWQQLAGAQASTVGWIRNAARADYEWEWEKFPILKDTKIKLSHIFKICYFVGL